MSSIPFLSLRLLNSSDSRTCPLRASPCHEATACAGLCHPPRCQDPLVIPATSIHSYRKEQEEGGPSPCPGAAPVRLLCAVIALRSCLSLHLGCLQRLPPATPLGCGGYCSAQQHSAGGPREVRRLGPCGRRERREAFVSVCARNCA